MQGPTMADAGNDLQALLQEEARLIEVADAVSKLMDESAGTLARLTKQAITVSAQLGAVREKLAMAKEGGRVLAA